jgi:hypothetical protein
MSAGGQNPIDLGDLPDIGEVFQRDADLGVKVRLDRVVNVRQGLTRPGGMLSTVLPAAAVAFGAGQVESIAGDDPRRRRLWVCAVDRPIWLSTSRAAITTGLYVPLGKDLEIWHFEQVFAAAADVFDARISYMIDLWADGRIESGP